jgi:hypothetical protein
MVAAQLGSITSGVPGTVRESSGREPGTVRWRWSCESAVCESFLRNTKCACASARITGEWVETFRFSSR